MDARLQRRVQRYGWNRAAPHYEAGWRDQLRPAQDRLLEMAVLRPGERVLDVACGTGLVSVPAAEAVGPDGELLGTDISEEMVSAARERAAASGLSNATFQRTGAEDLQLAEGGFDAALCGLGLMYVPDPVLACREMARALRDGGRVVVAVWGARANCGWAEIFPIVDARVKSEVCPLFFQLGTGEAMAVTMTQAGLTGVRLDRITTTLRYASEDEALGAAFVGGPVAMAVARFDDQVRSEAHAEYLESIEPFRNGDGYAIPGEFVIARGEVA